MSREWRLYLDDIAEACRKIAAYTAAIEFEEFTAHGLVHDAVVRNLEIIGEAAKSIPDDVRTRYPQIPWRRIAGLRDVLAHQYFGLEDATLWDVVRQQLPALLVGVERILREAPPGPT